MTISLHFFFGHSRWLVSISRHIAIIATLSYSCRFVCISIFTWHPRAHNLHGGRDARSSWSRGERLYHFHPLKLISLARAVVVGFNCPREPLIAQNVYKLLRWRRNKSAFCVCRWALDIYVFCYSQNNFDGGRAAAKREQMFGEQVNLPHWIVLCGWKIDTNPIIDCGFQFSAVVFFSLADRANGREFTSGRNIRGVLHRLSCAFCCFCPKWI